MGTNPGDRMMGQFERWTEVISGEFNSQAVANTPWAFVTMGTNPGERMTGQLERWVETISGDFKFQLEGHCKHTLCGRLRRGVQLAGGCKHVVGVCDDGDKVGRSDIRAAGAKDGGDIRGVQLAGHFKHSVGVCDDKDKVGGTDDGAAGAVGGGDCRGFQVAGCCKHTVVNMLLLHTL